MLLKMSIQPLSKEKESNPEIPQHLFQEFPRNGVNTKKPTKNSPMHFVGYLNG